MSKITNKSKTLIIVSSVISALLIIIAVVWYVAAGAGGVQKTGGMFILLAIVLMAVIATAALIYARLKRNEYTKEMSPEYFEAYEAVQDSLNSSNLTISERKEVLSDVAGMLYFAQKDGRALQNVVGEDTETFVVKVKQSFGYRNGVFFTLINGVMYLIMLLSLLQAVNFFAHEEVKTFFDTKMVIYMFFYMVMLSFLIMPLLRWSIAKRKFGWTFGIPFIFAVLHIALQETLRRIDINAAWIESYMHGEVGFITSWLRLAIYVCVIAMGFAAKWWIRRRSLKKL